MMHGILMMNTMMKTNNWVEITDRLAVVDGKCCGRVKRIARCGLIKTVGNSKRKTDSN